MAREIREIAPVCDVARLLFGKIPLAVISGGTSENVNLALRAVQVSHLFEAIMTANDPFPPKSEPHIFLEVARRLGVSAADCIVFEDGDPGIVGARKAGMKAIDIRPYLAQ